MTSKIRIEIVVTLLNSVRSQSVTRKNISYFSIPKLVYRTEMNGRKLKVFLSLLLLQSCMLEVKSTANTTKVRRETKRLRTSMAILSELKEKNG